MEKTSAPDGTLVNEKQQKVKNICKRTPATQCSIPNTKYHPEFHFHSHSTSSIMSSIRYEETEKRRKLTTACASLAMNVCVCVCVSVGVAQILYACPRSPAPCRHIPYLHYRKSSRWTRLVSLLQTMPLLVRASRLNSRFWHPLLSVCSRNTSTRCHGQDNSEIIDAWESPKFWKGKVKDSFRGQTLIDISYSVW